MNKEYYEQSCTDGPDMVVIGNVATGESVYGYKLISRNGEFTTPVDTEGGVWLIVGTDSGFEGITTLYYSRIHVELHEVE